MGSSPVMNDVEFENYKDFLLVSFQEIFFEGNKYLKEIGVIFSNNEKRLALQEVLKKMEENLKDTI